jgi:hypothetical protein
VHRHVTETSECQIDNPRDRGCIDLISPVTARALLLVASLVLPPPLAPGNSEIPKLNGDDVAPPPELNRQATR